jgi:flagellar motor switch protein FliM
MSASEEIEGETVVKEAAEEAENVASPTLPEGLLDRMTGKLGTRTQIQERGLLFQAALGPALEEMVQLATGLEIDVRPGPVTTGRRRELWTQLIDGSVYWTGGIRGWADNLGYFCGTPIVIGLVECLLGGADPETLETVDRALSGIELDMSLVIFETFNEVVAAAVDKSDRKNHGATETPKASIPELEDDPLPDFYAAAIGFELEFAGTSTLAYFVAPQEALLNTRPTKRATVKAEEAKAQSDWKERLSKRVVRSDVRLEARIPLDQMKLSEISRLQPGDVLAFSEEAGSTVILGGNGKDIYKCALGRTGQRYMVRIEGPTGIDENWRSAFS